MTTEPAHLVRVVSFNNGTSDELFALDETGRLWNFSCYGFSRKWTLLPPLERVAPIMDLYVHLAWDRDTCGHGGGYMSGILRALDNSGKLWELRWCNGECLWDAINLEAR